MTIYFGTARSTNDNAWKTCKMSKVYDRSHEITNKLCTSSYYKETLMLRSVPQMLKKVKNRCKQNFEHATCNWIKKILDEATWMANVFLISWFFYLFLSCSISLLVKYDFILRYETWVPINAIRASSFIENVPFFINHFSAKLASEIPAKLPRNLPFFLRICPWRSREIWLFFGNLPEALKRKSSILSCSRCYGLWPLMTTLIYWGYYTVARRYGFYVWVARTIIHEWVQRMSKILFLPRETQHLKHD